MEFITLGSLLGAFIITLALMAAHYLSPLLTGSKLLSDRQIASFSGGVAVAYVFLHMLPELVEGNEAVGRVLKAIVHETALFDLSIFAVALIGFLVFYGLELLAFRTGDQSSDSSATVYRLNLGVYCLKNFLITYTMPLRVQTGLFFSIVFTVAMSLHFILYDRGFNRHFPRRFSRKGRLLLLGSLFLGWLVTALTEPINVLLVSLMIAFLSGSIMYNVFKEELPQERQSSYLWFTIGLLGTAGLLMLQAALAPM